MYHLDTSYSMMSISLPELIGLMARFSVPSVSPSPTVSEASSRTLSHGSRSPSQESPPRSLEVNLLPRSAIRKASRKDTCRKTGKSLVTRNEKAGKLPALRSSPRSPGLSWEEGAVWWPDHSQWEDYTLPEEKFISREIVDEPDRTTSIGVIRGMNDLLDHENLVGMWDYTGFDGEGQQKETTWVFNDAGTLNRLILSKRRPARLPTVSTHEGLPESLIWHTLISLLKAVLWLHCGQHGYREKGRRRNWTPVIHNFINPANIFYSHPLAGVRARTGPYGTCRLGNFSRCVTLQSILDPEGDEEDQERKDAFEQVHSLGEETGYEAPELVLDSDMIPGPESDLWSIGAVMVAMMTGRTIWDLVLEIEFSGHVQAKRRSAKLSETWRSVPLVQRHTLLSRLAGNSDIAAALPEQYPFSLRAIVEAHLVVDPIYRADAVEMLRDVMADFEARRAEGMIEFAEPSAREKLADARRRRRQVVREAEDYLASKEAEDRLRSGQA